MAYAARTGLEIGADIVKMKYNGNAKDLAWALKLQEKQNSNCRRDKRRRKEFS